MVKAPQLLACVCADNFARRIVMVPCQENIREVILFPQLKPK
jgi:hypothetical protein